MLDVIVFSFRFLPKYNLWIGFPMNNGCLLYCPYPNVKSKSESSNSTVFKLLQSEYLQPIITQYFIDNKSEIWLLFLIAHSKR